MKQKTGNEYYQQVYGEKVYKLSIDAHFSCPNRDGTCGTKGCIFCGEDGSGAFAAQGQSIREQLEAAKKLVEKKFKGDKYIAYLQAFTNTYAPIEELWEIYTESIAPNYIVGLDIGTRPDCLPNETIELLKTINKQKPVTVELGLQTIHEKTAKYIRRGYELPVYMDAVSRLKAAGIHVVTHIILGLPGETHEMMVETAKFAEKTGTNGIKFHLLHVLRNTDLEKEYYAQRVSCLTLEEYGEILKKCLESLSYEMIIYRITGDGAKKDLIAPLWSADKKRVLNYLNKILK